MTKRTDAPTPQPTPTQIGTDDEQTVHRQGPTVTEHNQRMHEQRPGDCIGR